VRFSSAQLTPLRLPGFRSLFFATLASSAGTLLAAVALAVAGTAPRTATARKRAITRTVSEVAHHLGNTPAVCRASYVDPRVIDRYQSGATIADTLASLPAGDPDLSDAGVRRRVEAAVLELLGDGD